jgi:ubiquinone/menaquinone biosynthesis C-methylase UbiE
MSEHVYDGKLFEQATSTQHLTTRLELNRKYASTDFDAWLMSRLDVGEGEAVLDVGCGTGAQSLPFLKAVGPRGSVSALDISAESVQTLRTRAGNAPNLTAVAADMATLRECINSRFPVKQYDLAHSSYALYYSPQRLRVLETMRDALKPGGRLAVFTPCHPHGMVDFAHRFHAIAPEIDESLTFGPSVLEPFFRGNFWDVVVHFFHNRMRVDSVADFMTFYRATTYYVRDAEAAIAKEVGERIAKAGFFEYEKNGYLIIGTRRFSEQ